MEKAKALEVLGASLEAMRIEFDQGDVPLRILGVAQRVVEIIEEQSNIELRGEPVQGLLPVTDLKMSPAETRVALLVAKGLPNKVIGAELGIATYTVKVHVRSICRRNGLNNRVQVATRTWIQAELGLIS